jgi:hypothetical protein
MNVVFYGNATQLMDCQFSEPFQACPYHQLAESNQASTNEKWSEHSISVKELEQPAWINNRDTVSLASALNVAYKFNWKVFFLTTMISAPQIA